MKIYFDTCSINRPLDSKSQVRIALEAEAILGVLSLCDAGEVELISSDALTYEIKKNPNPIREEYGFQVLAKATLHISLNDTIEKRAKEFESLSIQPLDALHLAFAEAGNVDYFCTCDDKFFKKAKEIPNLKIAIVSPIGLIEEIEK
jgi:predicted nucleic acid-binding protein